MEAIEFIIDGVILLGLFIVWRAQKAQINTLNESKQFWKDRSPESLLKQLEAVEQFNQRAIKDNETLESQVVEQRNEIEKLTTVKIPAVIESATNITLEQVKPIFENYDTIIKNYEAIITEMREKQGESSVLAKALERHVHRDKYVF